MTDLQFNYLEFIFQGGTIVGSRVTILQLQSNSNEVVRTIAYPSLPYASTLHGRVSLRAT